MTEYPRAIRFFADRMRRRIRENEHTLVVLEERGAETREIEATRVRLRAYQSALDDAMSILGESAKGSSLPPDTWYEERAR